MSKCHESFIFFCFDLSVCIGLFFLLEINFFKYSCSIFQVIKPTKTKNKKGEVADGKKKAKKEPEEKWKWCVILCQQIVLHLHGQWDFHNQYSNKLKLLIRNFCMDFRWEEERYTDGVKWKFLEHKGPVFAPPYEPLPSNVKFYYDGKFAHHSVFLL